MIGEMNLQYSKKENESTFAHYQTEPMQVGKLKMKFNLEELDATGFTVFYKYAPSRSELMKARWNANDYSTIVPFETESCGSFYQYLIVFKIATANSAIRNITAL